MKYAKVFPLTHVIAVKIPAKWYRKVIGCLEIACGIALTLIPKGKMNQNNFSSSWEAFAIINITFHPFRAHQENCQYYSHFNNVFKRLFSFHGE